MWPGLLHERLGYLRGVSEGAAVVEEWYRGQRAAEQHALLAYQGQNSGERARGVPALDEVGGVAKHIAGQQRPAG